MAIDAIALIRAATFACLMTLGWTLLVNVPRRYIWQCLLLTLLGYGLRELLKQLSVNLILATFVAAGISSFVAIYLAKKYLLTPKMILVPAMLCMMPGITAYKAMISFVQLGYYGYNPQVFTQMMDFSFNAMFVTAALVFGISLPTSFWYRTKPIV